jgi:O-acetyl-ADP-ribose deacetylase (regulator of RNase III)
MNQLIGNILYAGDKYIIHQTFAKLKIDNALNRSGQGLGKALFDRYPYANVYANRVENYEPQQHELPGNIIICGDGIKQRFIINAIGQYYPSISDEHDALDTKLKRQEYFEACLDKVSRINNIQNIAIPWGIACGVGGGDWSIYFNMLQTFSKKIMREQNAIVNLYKI